VSLRTGIVLHRGHLLPGSRRGASWGIPALVELLHPKIDRYHRQSVGLRPGLGRWSRHRNIALRRGPHRATSRSSRLPLPVARLQSYPAGRRGDLNLASMRHLHECTRLQPTSIPPPRLGKVSDGAHSVAARQDRQLKVRRTSSATARSGSWERSWHPSLRQKKPSPSHEPLSGAC